MTRPALYERELELERLSQRIADALGGEGSTIALEGEAGIGKSTLVERAIRDARAAGMNVLHARGGELERGFAYGVVRQLFESTLRTHEAREALLAGAAGLASAALSLSERGNAAAGDTGAVLHGLYWLSANLAAEQPLLVAIDDAHWCDDASIGFLSYLARRIDELPAVLLYATRPAEGAAASLPAAAEPGAVAVVLRPAALSQAAADDLIDHLLGGERGGAFKLACRSATGGNPFLLHELLRALKAEDSGPQKQSVEAVATLAPRTIARATLTRLKRLGPAVGELAFAIAVLGARAELRHAASLAEVHVDAAIAAADELVAVGILRTGRPLEFIHPIVRTTVYAEIPPARRAASHKRAAILLHEDGASPEALAPHLLASEPSGDRWVVERLRAAAARVQERGASDAAVTYLERARSEPPEPDDRLAVLLELGSAEIRAGRPGALEHVRAAFQLARDTHTQEEAANELGFALSVSDMVPEAVELLTPLIADLTVEDEEAGLRLDARLACVAQLDSATAGPIRERLSRHQGLRGETPAQRLMLASLAFDAVHRPASPDRAIGFARLALRDGLLLEEQPEDSAAFFLAAWALLHCDELQDAERYFAMGVDDARRRGSLPSFAVAAGSHCQALVRQGRLAEAEAEANSALDALRVQPQLFGRPMLIGALLDAMVERADLDACESLLAEHGMNEPRLAFGAASLLLYSRGHMRLAAGDPSAALVDFEQIRARDELAGMENAAIPTRGSAALAHDRLGHADGAVALAAEELAQARTWGTPSALSFALRVAATVERGDRTIELLQEAADVSRDAQSRLEHARSLTELGAALRRAGQRHDARAPLREARELAHRCGASRLERRAHDELIASGARPRRIRLTGLESLTSCERRVAQLAADGLANREIAQALFVTTRTVEGHLTQAYMKLDISSREQLGSALGSPMQNLA